MKLRATTTVITLSVIGFFVELAFLYSVANSFSAVGGIDKYRSDRTLYLENLKNKIRITNPEILSIELENIDQEIRFIDEKKIEEFGEELYVKKS